MRIARITRHDDGRSFQIDEKAPPPVLSVQVSAHLSSICRSLVDALSARAGELSKARRQRDQNLSEFTVSDTPGFWLLHTLNTSIPVLREFSEGAGVHPVMIYREMLSLAGALLTFRLTPSTFPATITTNRERVSATWRR